MAADYTFYERGGLPFNLALHGDAFVLPDGLGYTEGGIYHEYGIETRTYNGAVTFEKETGSGIYFASSHNFLYTPYEGDRADFVTPENRLTYTGNLHVEFSTLFSPGTGMFSPPEGFSLSFSPALLYKPGYKPWGFADDLYEHDSLPGLSLESSLRFGRPVNDRFYLGGILSFYGGLNLYESEKWSVGQTDFLSSGPRLSGYLGGEFQTESGLILNLDGQSELIEEFLILYGRHDVYWEMDENELYQGSAAGVALALPFEIEFAAEGGIGWNAERERGPGWSLQLNFARYFFW